MTLDTFIDRKLIVISSHERSGTHLTIDLFRKQFQECRAWKYLFEGSNKLYWAIDHQALNNDRIDKWWKMLPRSKWPIIKTHFPVEKIFSGELPHVENTYPGLSKYIKDNATCFHVFRDGRDVLMSYHRYCKGWLPGANCSNSEFIRQKEDGISRAKRWALTVKNALEQQGVHPIQFEQIVKNTKKVIEDAANICGFEPLWKYPLLPNKITSRFQGRLTRLQIHPESTAVLGYTEEPLEKWRKVWNAEDKAFFQQEAGDMLIKLGYESSPNWINVDCP